MMDIQRYCSSSGGQIMQIFKGAFPIRSVKKFVSTPNYGFLRSVLDSGQDIGALITVVCHLHGLIFLVMLKNDVVL